MYPFHDVTIGVRSLLSVALAIASLGACRLRAGRRCPRRPGPTLASWFLFEGYVAYADAAAATADAPRSRSAPTAIGGELAPSPARLGRTRARQRRGRPNPRARARPRRRSEGRRDHGARPGPISVPLPRPRAERRSARRPPARLAPERRDLGADRDRGVCVPASGCGDAETLAAPWRGFDGALPTCVRAAVSAEQRRITLARAALASADEITSMEAERSFLPVVVRVRPRRPHPSGPRPSTPRTPSRERRARARTRADVDRERQGSGARRRCRSARGAGGDRRRLRRRARRLQAVRLTSPLPATTLRAAHRTTPARSGSSPTITCPGVRGCRARRAPSAQASRSWPAKRRARRRRAKERARSRAPHALRRRCPPC